MKENTKKNGFSQALKKADPNIVRLFIILIICTVIFWAAKPDNFLTISNIRSMGAQACDLGMISLGVFIGMIAGGLDMSLVGICVFSGCASALIMTNQWFVDWFPNDFVRVIVAVLFAFAVGILVGMFNGFLIANLRTYPMLICLGTMNLFTGLALMITKGQPVTNFPAIFTQLANVNIGPIPLLLIIATIAYICAHIYLAKTAMGAKTYLYGANARASRFSGINNVRVQMTTFAITGVCAATCGLFLMCKTNSMRSDYASSYQLQGILIAILGGVNPGGGFGKIVGAYIALLVCQILSSGFNIAGFTVFVKEFAWGALLIILMLINYYAQADKSPKAKARAAARAAKKAAKAAAKA